MAIAFRAAATEAILSTTAVAEVDKPTGTAEDDILLAEVSHSYAGTVTPPAGWTALWNLPSAGGNTPGFAAFYKVAGGSEPATYTFSIPGAAVMVAAVVAYSGGRPGDAIHVSGIAQNLPAGDNIHIRASSITTTLDECMIVGLFAGAAPGASYTPPAGMTERVDVYSHEGSGIDYCNIEIAEVAQAVAGATGAKDATISTLVSGFKFGALVALRVDNLAPLTPTLLTPASSASVDAAAGFSTTHEHNDPDGDAQAKYAFRRKTTGAYEYWRASDSTWQATIQWNTSATEGVTFGSGKWTNGNTYLWSVATEDAGGRQSGFASDRVLIATTPPSVSVTAPASPVEDTSRPTIGWEVTDAEDDAQTHYHAKVFSEGQYTEGGFDPETSDPTWDSEETTSTDVSVQTGTNLTNATTYRAYVKAKAGGLWSEWDNAEFDMDLAVPSPPQLVATPE